ncbi:MAG: TIGR03118 family protein, partial [Steroidobacteraceae bacterium]
MKIIPSSLCIGFAVGAAMALAAAPSAAAVRMSATDLVTDDQTAQPARITDPGLVNAWGLSYPPTGPFWV